jgi:hypothetical protein
MRSPPEASLERDKLGEGSDALHFHAVLPLSFCEMMVIDLRYTRIVEPASDKIR